VRSPGTSDAPARVVTRLALLAVLVLAGCTNSAAFLPTESITASGPGGLPAASYDIRSGPDHAPHIRVNVWSTGAFVDDGRTFTHVDFEVRNTGDEAVSIDPRELRLDSYAEDGGQLPTAQLVHAMAPGSSMMVPPREASTFHFVFQVPVEIAPDDIGSFRLRWELDHEDGQRYVQLTDFRRVPDVVATNISSYDPIYGFYDPFLYGPPYGHHLRHHVPIRRVLVQERERSVHPTQRR